MQIDKKQMVFDYIKSYISENGYAPSVREVCSACSIKSTATAHGIMNTLADQGIINKTGNKKRAVSLKSNSISIPLIGTVAAGEPIFASENYDEMIAVPSNLFTGEDLFMLSVKGHSMINVGIFEGDKIIVRKQSVCDDGDIVVALVEDSATVKRFFKRNGKIILHPENDEMDDFVFDSVLILGKVVGLIRNID